MRHNIGTIIFFVLYGCTGDGDPPTMDEGPTPTTESDNSSSSGEESTDTTDTSGSTDESESESSSSSEESTGEPVGCEPEVRGEHEACGSSCFSECDAGLECQWSYAGGYLAQCAKPCQEDSECSEGDQCAGEYCVTACGPNRECAEGFYCYPGTMLDGTPIEDPAHPLPHCMPKVG